ncbi:hypothetical protein LWI28_021200 [Acer negundo]|uniref:signal-recognition-particle GTPase n=1 Tax=Acer negundo TaxID=4023 RepID=A0AAD5IWZ6_ACENE|nr:hypothetical protein LWI28_021200 [Acer negundo]
MRPYIIDDNVLNECLNEITRALLQSDVQLKLVSDMQTNIKRIVSLHDLAGGHNKRRIIQQYILWFTKSVALILGNIYRALSILDPGKPSFTPKKGKASVIMFVGLQGSGKTTTRTKYVGYHQKKGWKPALVSIRPGAFDQLKQDAATKAKIPCFGSYKSDPVRIAVEGVKIFKKENCDLIIIDTSGCHKQEASLFEEMRQVAEATKPDLVIFVMDSSIGQAAFDQAQAFKQSVSVGAVIITKMDGHAKGVGALSAREFEWAKESVSMIPLTAVAEVERSRFLQAMSDAASGADVNALMVPVEELSDVCRRNRTVQEIVQGALNPRELNTVTVS